MGRLRCVGSKRSGGVLKRNIRDGKWSSFFTNRNAHPCRRRDFEELLLQVPKATPEGLPVEAETPNGEGETLSLYTFEAGAYFNGFEGSTSPESQGRGACDPRRGGDFSPQVFKFRQKSSYHMLHHATVPPAQLHRRATDSPTASDFVRTSKYYLQNSLP